jgi:hypothetical protein
MRETDSVPGWARHLVYRTQCTKTTWKLRLGVPITLALALWSTSGWWTTMVARGLVCEANSARSDAILVETFDTTYLVFQRAADMRREGLAPRVFVQSSVDPASREPGEVAVARVRLLASLARLGEIEIISTRQAEPIMLNAARDIQTAFERNHIKSVLVVVPLFRSRRSELVYAATLGRAGIEVRCEPVQGSESISHWTRSWHGIQNVVEQWLKLQYYRFYVLPRLA